MISVSELAIYPMKSCRQLPVNHHRVDAFGLTGDRRWMLIDSNGKFLSQRTHPVMVQIECSLNDQGINLTAPGMGTLTVPVPGNDNNVIATVWNDDCQALDAGDQAAEWCSTFLKNQCRLVYMPDSSFRQVSLKYAEPGIKTGFADGFPFLLISEASLAELNRRLDIPVPMVRFRPNIVVSGCEAFAEDSWKRIRIGNIDFTVAKPCTRCVMTTINTDTLEKAKEPLKTLSAYRRAEKGVVFGQNLIHHGVGELSIGMSVEVLE
ncbi:MOSC domain-containing protein [Sansalvadorimonas sp. 2012CJ34-2]|uniref:MOSC domain-containing protein n=1 Tax=Parendozoicomonas callyspongiae TaxID=2942213 RepID=A0ABT0PEX7_9GAMM|nr:MOSC domain-containing protein [Sansalvadorimonas sp. 2012CJ34-2]MCL6269858.1 MOSC domain-containing protein [Sansalvadorimonas sp. 2012CJ34-2]